MPSPLSDGSTRDSIAAKASFQWAAQFVSYFFPARIFAHLARCAAAILLRPAAEIVRLGFGARPFAHRAFCARLIRLRAEAETVCPGFP
jgi:hypothetical protein